jgi:hypothetical protein
MSGTEPSGMNAHGKPDLRDLSEALAPAPLDAKATSDAQGGNGQLDPAPEELIPDRDVLVRFVDVMFRNASRDGFVSLRTFEDNNKKDKPPVAIEAIRLDDDRFERRVLARAHQAANWGTPTVFCPPVCTFKDNSNAKRDNLHEGVALSAECDQAPAAARATLEALLGPATIVVESGGEWTNGETGEVEPKLHLHWRLKKPAAGVDELAALYEARALAVRLVGADPTNKSIAHPIRWPGSWHRKRTPKLAQIAALVEGAEIDLGEALERLREKVGDHRKPARTNGAGEAGNGRHKASDPRAVAAALAVIPNGTNLKAHHWEYWNKTGMTIWASTEGSEEGRAAFHEWSAKSPKYDFYATEARWQHYFSSPPTELGFGSLVWLAQQQVPGWAYESPDGGVPDGFDEVMADAHRKRGEADDDEAGEEAPRPTLAATPYQWTNPASIPLRDWIYGDLLIRKFVSMTVAPGGVGKSSLVAAETLAQVAGKNLLGVTPKGRSRVWLLNLEDPQEETQRKIQAAALHHGLTPEDIGDRLFVDSGRDQSLVVATMTREGPTIVRPVVDALVAEIIDKQIDVLIIDPFVSCHEVPENDNTAQDMVVKEWGKVAEAGNCAVHLVDHTRKMGSSEAEVTTETSRGAKAKTDACRVVRAVSRMTKEDGEKAAVENHRLYFRTYNDKANLAPPADKSDWFELTRVDLGNGPAVTIGFLGDGARLDAAGDSVGVVTQWKWPDAMAGVTDADFKKVAAEIGTGEWRKNAQAGDWVGKAVAKALRLNLSDKADKAKVAGMIKVWVGRGALVEVNKQDRQRKVKTFVEVAEEV